jgi:hypothetical protein
MINANQACRLSYEKRDEILEGMKECIDHEVTQNTKEGRFRGIAYYGEQEESLVDDINSWLIDLGYDVESFDATHIVFSWLKDSEEK